MRQAEYPYTGKRAACKATKGWAGVASWAQVTPNNVYQLMTAIYGGPMSVAVDASSKEFQGYKKGIINTTTCGTELNHEVTAIGYGLAGTQRYIMIKNSYGENWGDNGFGYIAAVDGPGICGIQSDPRTVEIK